MALAVPARRSRLFLVGLVLAHLVADQPPGGRGGRRVTFNAHILETGTQSYRLRTSRTARAKNAS